MGVRDEILQQPDVVARILERDTVFERLGRAIRDAPPEHVVIAARGTSDRGSEVSRDRLRSPGTPVPLTHEDARLSQRRDDCG